MRGLCRGRARSLMSLLPFPAWLSAMRTRARFVNDRSLPSPLRRAVASQRLPISLCRQPCDFVFLLRTALYPAMSLRRSLGSVLQSMQRLVLAEGSIPSLTATCWPHAPSTLTSLRILQSWRPHSPPGGAMGPSAALGGGRCFAASAAAEQQAAPAAAAAEEESLEQIRSRIFGTHIGGLFTETGQAAVRQQDRAAQCGECSGPHGLHPLLRCTTAARLPTNSLPTNSLHCPSELAQRNDASSVLACMPCTDACPAWRHVLPATRRPQATGCGRGVRCCGGRCWAPS